jgi:hypothetical protein
VSSADWAYLAARTSADFENGGHRTYFVPVLAAIAATGQDVAAYAETVGEYYGLVSNIYGAVLDVAGGTLGVGYDQLDVPLRNMLGAGAFLTMQQHGIRRPVTRDATYQILPADFYTDLIITTSGTRTYTLPAWSDMPDYVPPLVGKNRSGNNLTVQRSGTDTMDAAATSITVPTGSHWEVFKSETSGTWETRVFA